MGTESIVYKPSPNEHWALTKRVMIGEQKVYITIGEYEDGSICEIWIRLDKEGSKLRAYEIVSKAINIGLQRGIPLGVYFDEFRDQTLAPEGMTNDPNILIAKSIIDFVMRWLNLRYDYNGKRRSNETNTNASDSELLNTGECK